MLSSSRHNILKRLACLSIALVLGFLLLLLTVTVAAAPLGPAVPNSESLQSSNSLQPLAPAAADFVGVPVSGPVPLTVNFTADVSPGPKRNWVWDFGDGVTSTEKDNATHVYTVTGIYTVTLSVNAGGTDFKVVKPSYITAFVPVKADFIGSPTDGAVPLTVDFTNTSTGTFDTCAWDFGDGNTSTDCATALPVTTTYEVTDTFTVTLTVSGLGGSDTISKVNYINVRDPISVTADFSGNPTIGIAPLTVTFTNSSTGDYDTCSWDFGDTGTSTDCSDPSHQYTIPGVYTVSLEVSGKGGVTDTVKTNYISVYDPVVADFSGSPTGGPAPLTVTFTNTSTGDYDTCSWDFGDTGTSTNCSNPSHQYTVPGVYTVSLEISGDGGVTETVKTNYITVYTPAVANFSGNPTSGNAPLKVNFVNQSTGDFSSCLWEFGDGGTSTDCIAPSYDYTAAGIYNVSLTVSGLGGTDKATKANYITVIGPVVANFQGSPRIGTPPLTVNFSNLSTGSFNNCTWNFGDGGTSNSCGNPSHTYVAIGNYTVSLTLSGPGGMDMETKTDYIMVKEELLIYLPLVFR